MLDRVVIHPKYRTIGLGAKLIRETLPLAGTPYVELIAVMAKYSPFAEKTGMTKISQQQHANSVSDVSQTLSTLGFDLQLLGSQRYVQEKLEALNPQEIGKLKEAFIKNKHPRFKKAFSPDGEKSNYIRIIRDADLEKIAKLIRLVAILSQTKVYLFWKKQFFDG